MSLPSQKAADFSARHGLCPEGVDQAALLAEFLREMDRGLSGAGGSLAMIPSFISVDRPVPRDKPVVVMDAGGTNLRVAIVSFPASGAPVIRSFARHGMPGTAGEVGREEFFRQLAECLVPVADQAEWIGCCFSYAVDMGPDGDGRLLTWTKEVRAPEVVGEYIGRHVLAALRARGFERKIILLNDTIATLLAGKTAGESRRYGSYVGFILGTGTNIAYVEANRNIRKRNDLDPAGSQAINVESGNFARRAQTDVDAAYDRTTSTPGRYMFEKMISGAYLGGLCLQTLKTAAQEGVFSPAAAERIEAQSALSTKEMDNFLGNPFAEGPLVNHPENDGDREIMCRIMAQVVERAAALTAVNLGAAIIKCGAGHDPLHPVCANVDGSTFYKTRGYKSLVEEHLRRLLRPRGIFCEMIHVEHSPVLGAAVAGLTRE
jgi:hexokinase